MIRTIKKPIKNLPKNLQVHANWLAQANDNKNISLELYDKAKHYFARLFNKYMQNKHSKSWNYLLDYIDDYFIVVSLEYINK